MVDGWIASIVALIALLVLALSLGMPMRSSKGTRGAERVTTVAPQVLDASVEQLRGQRAR